MNAISQAVESQFGGSRPYLRLLLTVTAFAGMGLVLGAQNLFRVQGLELIAVAATVLIVCIRYPWFGAALPLAVFSVIGIGLSTGITVSSAEINLADVIILPAFLCSAMRVVSGRRSLPRLDLPAFLMAVWLVLAVSTGFLYGNTFHNLGTEAHLMLYIPLGWFLASVEIRSAADLKKVMAALIAAVAITGIKAGLISFLVGHSSNGFSSVWQAATMNSAALGGQRTILSGGDTMFVVVMPMIVAVSMFVRQRRLSLLLAAASLPILFGLLVSLTRTNWATVMLAVLLAVLLGSLYRGKRAASMALATLALTGAVLAVASSLTIGASNYDLGELIQRRFEAGPGAGSGNLEYRVIEGQALMAKVDEHQLLGNGLGAEYSFLEFRGRSSITWAHNGHLWVLLKSGFVGLALFLSASALVIWKSIRAMRLFRLDWVLGAAPLGFSLALLCVMMMSLLVNKISNPEGAFMIGMAMAMPAIVYRIRDREFRPREGGRTIDV